MYARLLKCISVYQSLHRFLYKKNLCNHVYYGNTLKFPCENLACSLTHVPTGIFCEKLEKCQSLLGCRTYDGYWSLLEQLHFVLFRCQVYSQMMSNSVWKPTIRCLSILVLHALYMCVFEFCGSIKLSFYIPVYCI